MQSVWYNGIVQKLITKGDSCHDHCITEQHKRVVSLSRVHSEIISKHHVGKLLKKCNGTKEKGGPAITLLRYKLGNIIVGKSMYMQQKIGSFKEEFSKNTSIGS